MTLLINLPEHAEAILREFGGDNLDRAALEALAAEGYRTGKISFYNVQQMLGFDNRWDTEEFLGSRGLNLYYTLADLEEDGKMIYKDSGFKPL